MAELLLKDEVFAVVGAAMEVYYQIGSGFLEPIYQEALEIELSRRKIPFEPQKHLKMFYKTVQLKKDYIADLVCYGLKSSLNQKLLKDYPILRSRKLLII